MQRKTVLQVMVDVFRWLDDVWEFMSVLVVKLEAPSLERDGMLGSILGGSNAFKSFDVMLQRRGNMPERWIGFENEEKMNDQRWKWTDFEKRNVFLFCFLPLSLSFSTWVNVAYHCFGLYTEAHLFFPAWFPSECFLESSDQSRAIQSFWWHR